MGPLNSFHMSCTYVACSKSTQFLSGIGLYLIAKGSNQHLYFVSRIFQLLIRNSVIQFNMYTGFPFQHSFLYNSTVNSAALAHRPKTGNCKHNMNKQSHKKFRPMSQILESLPSGSELCVCFLFGETLFLAHVQMQTRKSMRMRTLPCLASRCLVLRQSTRSG